MTAPTVQPGRRTLRRTVAFAFVPLALVVVGAAICQVVLVRNVHRDVERLFEELREVALVRALVDELRGVELWVQAAPSATASNQRLALDDVRQHHAAASATLQRFAINSDPSTPSHDDQEAQLLREVRAGLAALARGLDGDASLGTLAGPLAQASHAARTLGATIEEESHRIGDHLDRRSDEMAQFLLLLGLVSIATAAALAWLLIRRVLRPVLDLQQAAVRLGQGDLTAVVPHGRDDELGDLAATLRTMADRLRSSREELEARVEQRSREVLRSARLAQLGTLAAGIAHEINNPLASIVAGSEGLLRDLDRRGGAADESQRDYLRILHKEAMRARDITARLLRFAHQDSPRREIVQLRRETEEVVALFAHQCRDAGVDIVIEAVAAGPTIEGDPAEWRQVLFNLLRNALDASPRGGRIRVRLAAEDDQALLAVADDGPGVPPELQDRIFEPFVTTKEPGKGTGLGLAIVHRIVEAHRGRITVENGARGACFTITVPLASA